MIRTVLGDVEPSALGPTDYHEHLFQISPLLPGDELDDEAASTAEAGLLRSSGFAAMIDATPVGLGRDASALARASAASGLTVVATTGRHREAHYRSDDPIREWPAAGLAELFIRDIEEGMPADDGATLRGEAGPRAASPVGAEVRAGILKAGIDYWRISRFERETLEAVSAAHRSTGAAVMVHLEFCTAAHEVLDVLAAQGVSSHRVVLAHADRDPDAGLHADLAARGAYLGYDGFARPRIRSDQELLDLTVSVVDAGAGDRILLGGDMARRTRYQAYGGMPGLAYLGARYLPRLVHRIGEDVVRRLTVANPARLLDLRGEASASETASI